jgi:L-asparaginase
MTEREAPSPARPRVALVGLGGTIAITGSDEAGVAHGRAVTDLLATLPGITVAAGSEAGAAGGGGAGVGGIEVEPVDLRMLPGSALSLDDLAAVADAVRERLEAGAAGVVVTQGTDTIEETSYLLHLLHHRSEPVVVTGAMRGPQLVGDDGPANLLAAIRTAASPRARELGCLVVFADEIHAAARVRKTHSSSIGTFASPNGGPLGYVVEGEPRILSRPVRRTIVPPPRRRWPRVGLVTATLGASLDEVTDGLDGLVVAGFGVGHVPPAWVPVLADLARRVPVVLASRTGAGAVHSAMYDYAGSERDMQARGLIAAGLLHPYKARVLLLLALACGLDRASIRALFADAG